jgi:hypothetical protein
VQRPVKGLCQSPRSGAQRRSSGGEILPRASSIATIDAGATQAHSATHHPRRVCEVLDRMSPRPTLITGGYVPRLTHLSKPPRSRHAAISKTSNNAVRQNFEATTRVMPPWMIFFRALGAMAPFWGEVRREVRVVEIGGPWSLSCAPARTWPQRADRFHNVISEPRSGSSNRAYRVPGRPGRRSAISQLNVQSSMS